MAVSSDSHAELIPLESAASTKSDYKTILEKHPEVQVTFLGLLQTNRPFRLYFMSLLATYLGMWLNYIASISVIEEILGSSSSSSRKSISILVIVRLLPNVLLLPFGGLLADARDRRQTMMILDSTGAVIVLFYLLAYHLKSIPLIYLVAWAQQCLAALYEPCKISIIPLLVPDEEMMKKATTLSTCAWSLMGAFGASLGGVVVAQFGCNVCFVLDSVTYVLSTCLMWSVGGTWNVADPKSHHESIWDQIQGMMVDGAKYVYSSFFGGIVLFKATGAFCFGAADVLNVMFSERDGKENSSLRLGLLFAAVGVGCLVGPVASDSVTDMKNPRTLQLACIYSFVAIIVGYLGWGFFSSFAWICVMGGIRAAGSAILWVYSNLLLQKFSTPDMLGRISSVDYGLSVIGEAASAWLCGVLGDNFGLSGEQVSFVMSEIATAMLIAWALYHCQGCGAANDEEVKKAGKQSEVPVELERLHVA